MPAANMWRCSTPIQRPHQHESAWQPHDNAFCESFIGKLKQEQWDGRYARIAIWRLRATTCDACSKMSTTNSDCIRRWATVAQPNSNYCNSPASTLAAPSILSPISVSH